jgi:hypothetical protein
VKVVSGFCSEQFDSRQKIVHLKQYKIFRAAQSLRHKLGDFADQPFFAQEMGRARQFYFSSIDPEFLEEYDEFVAERFFEWFIFDLSLSPGKTILELFAETPDLSSEESGLLAEWMNSRLNFYEVREVFSGQGVVLEELFGQKRFFVQDGGASRSVQPGMILYIRILKVGDVYEFSTSGLLLPPFWKELIVSRIREDIKSYCRKRKLSLSKGREAYWRENACLLNAWVIELGMSSYLFYRAGVGESSNPGNRPGAREGLRIEKSLGSGDDSLFRIVPETSYSWPSPECSRVAVGVVNDLKGYGYSRVQVESALRLWCDYCLQARPSIRKVSLWVAVVAYTMSRLEYDRRINQTFLAEKYGVSVSAISGGFRKLCRALELVVFDRRYSTRRLVLPDLLENYPLLEKILRSLRL